MTTNTMKQLTRFTLALQSVESMKQADTEEVPKDAEFSQLHFRASSEPGHIEVFLNGKWWATAGITMLNGLFTVCPLGADPSQVPPRPPLRPVPTLPGGRG